MTRLNGILLSVGFSDHLVSLIINCTSQASSLSILQNSAQLDSFQPLSSIQQGDPLSPYLFVLCMEVLSHHIDELCRQDIGKAFGYQGMVWSCFTYVLLTTSFFVALLMRSRIQLWKLSFVIFITFLQAKELMWSSLNWHFLQTLNRKYPTGYYLNLLLLQHRILVCISKCRSCTIGLEKGHIISWQRR